MNLSLSFLRRIQLIYLVLIGLYQSEMYAALPTKPKVDSLVVVKSKRRLYVYQQGKLLKTYAIALGGNPVGAKRKEGDQKTPEGLYTINDKNDKSRFHKNLGISYPNQEQLKTAKKLGYSAGGDIKIHGLKNGLGLFGRLHRWFDWTDGCIALTNDEIDELYQIVPIGTPINILP